MLPIYESKIPELSVCKEGIFSEKAFILNDDFELIIDKAFCNCLVLKNRNAFVFNNQPVFTLDDCYGISKRGGGDYEGSLYISYEFNPVIFIYNNLKLLVFVVDIGYLENLYRYSSTAEEFGFDEGVPF